MGEVDWIRKEVMKRDWDFDSIIDWEVVPLYTPVEISILAGSLWMDGDKAEKASESCRTKSLSKFMRFKRGLENHVMPVDPTSVLASTHQSASGAIAVPFECLLFAIL